MAILHTSGTQLDLRPRKPLSRLMLWAVGSLFVLSLFSTLFSLNMPADFHLMNRILNPVLSSSFNPSLNPTPNQINWNTISWVLGGVCIAIGLYSSIHTRQFRFRKLHFVFFISACFVSTPLFFPQSNLESSLYRILAIWFGGLLLLSLQQSQWNPRQRNYLIAIIFFSSLLFIGYHYLSTSHLPPKILSSLLSTSLVLNAYLMIQNKQHPWRRFALGFIPLFIIPMVFLINTFIGWFSLFSCLLLIQPYFFRRLGLESWLHWFCCLLLGFALGVFLAASEPSFWGRFFDNFSTHNWQLLMQIKDMLLEQPVFGYGYAQFESAYSSFVVYQSYWDPTYPTVVEGVIHPWNEWLYWWVEGGLFALAGLLFVLFFCLYQLRKTPHPKRLFFAAIFLPQFVQATLSTPFYHTNFHWFLLIILMYWFNQQIKSSAYQKITYQK